VICAIVVTFEPDDKCIQNVLKLAHQFPNVVVIRNSYCHQKSEKAFDLETYKNILLINNEKNLGLATALNQGVKVAISQKFKYVMLFDQDTEVLQHTHHVMQQLCKKVEKRFGLLGASHKKTDKKINIDLMPVKSNITSGSLIPISVFVDVGLFREDYFIDSIDSEFCLRLRKNGYSIFRSKEKLINHEVGDPEMHSFFFFKIKSTNHSATRRYYIARNYLVTARDYNSLNSKLRLKWLYKSLKTSVKFALTILLCEENKIAKIRAIILGLHDGLLGRLGEHKF
jgi:rhamnosyltransferase